jgi:hypothetical protein
MRIGVWHAISQTQIIGPHLDHTLNTEVYLTILNVFVNYLADEDLTATFIQQDGARCHMSYANMREI